jgi:hypothetical protein
VRLALVVLAALVLAAPVSAARHSTSAGLSVEVPSGWTVVHEQRLAVRGHGALVHIIETIAYADVHRFPVRPRRFALTGPAEFQACGPREGKGWLLRFRDGNRGFYAYVYLGQRGTRSEVLALLDSLKVRPRGR